jgi:hypothetical protein
MSHSLLRLLLALGRINPAIWDAIIPHGPVLASFSKASPGSQVELNPQPIPPGHELELASAKMANQIAHAAIAAEAAGNEGATRIVSRAVEEWCGTPPGHRPIPWPGPWPFPWTTGPRDPELDPHASQIVGALTLASVASRMSEGAVQTALAEGAEKLLEAGLAD